MGKTTYAEKLEPEEKSDGLEIISIGSLYKGRWDKKYWSSSRGKDRYPYPVGFQAIRAYNGTTYKMEIHEGASGPRFVITSADGYSCSGKTPDIAWEEFQKRGCPQKKIWHGKRLSSKMDGLELFGFKNSFVQRLLRELVADLNGIAEQSLNLCNEASRLEHDDSRQSVGTHPDLLPCPGGPHVKGKRGRRCESKNGKLRGGTVLKRPRTQEFRCSGIASIKRRVSEDNEAQNTGGSAPMQIASSVGESPNCFSRKNGFSSNQIISHDQERRTVHAKTSGVVDAKNNKALEITDSFSKDEHFHRSQEAELNTSKFLAARENKKEFKDCCDVDLCAPDTIGYVQENTSNSTPSTLDKNAYNEKAHQIASGESLSVEVNDVAKSMMTLLLPQVIPFLKDSTTEKLTSSPSGKLPSIMNSSQEDQKIGNLLEAASSVMTENAYVEREEKMHVKTTSVSFVIADSFEPTQSENHKSEQAIFHSSIAEASRASFDKETCSTSHEQHGSGVLPNESSNCQADIKLTKNAFHHSSELDSEDLPQDFDICIPDSVLEHTPPLDRVISESNNDACPNVKENSNTVGLNSMEKDHKAAHDFEICLPGSVPGHLPPQDRVISKSSNDSCIDMEENSKQVGLNSMENDQKAAIDFDICIPDSVLEHKHKPPPDRVIFKCNKDACTNVEENSNQVGLHSLEKGHKAANDLDICILDSVIEHSPSSERVVSEGNNDACTDMEENSNQDELTSMEKDHKAANDFDVYIPDSVLEDTPPPDMVVSKSNEDACTDMEEVSNQCGLYYMEKGHKVAHDFDLCIPDSVLEHSPLQDRVISKSNTDTCTDMEENLSQVGLNSVEKDYKAANGFDICIPDSVLEDTPPPDMVVSKSNADDCTDIEEVSNQCGSYYMEKGHKVAHDFGLCIPDSVLEHSPPQDRVISRSNTDTCTDMEENLNQVGLNSVEKNHKAAHDFTGDVSNAPGRDTEDEIVGKTNAETMALPSIQAPIIAYTRRKSRTVDPLTGLCLLPESAKTNEDGELVTSEIKIVKGTSPPSETIQLHASGNELCEPVLLDNQARDEVQSDDLQRDDSVTNSQIKQSPGKSDNGSCLRDSKENIVCPDDLFVSHVEATPIRSDVPVGYSNLPELNTSIPCWDLKPSSCENNCSSNEAQVISELNPHRNDDISDNLGKTIKFVGCYFLPMPVSSLFLSRRGNEILICVICESVVDQERTLFTYKVSVKEPNIGCPSFIAYTSLRLPDPKHNFNRETLVERSGVQLTPDGQYIVLLGSIKTPYCRGRKICCDCSSCMSVCSEENALKIVQVEHGHVSVVATLKTFEVVHCIVICEPNLLCSVGESGRLHVWVMNSTWRDKVEDFIIPADDSISPGIVELKRIPKCTHLVVAFNCVGEFSLWDISKRDCVSSFSASTNPFIQFLPVSLFNCQRNSPGFTSTSLREQVDQLLGATRLWCTDQKEPCSFLPSEEGDIAMWLLVSSPSDIESPHDFISSHCQINTARNWRLALLVKNDMILGSSFNIRTAAIGVLGSCGIIGTPDGLVHIWELYGGSKLGTLQPFQAGIATCIATDELRGGALGVAGGEGQLLIYVPHKELDAE
ncbi:hypothetical protein QN277_029000 [Acacia crassicarpa]|uniref:Uncharacterized protein n=1 Tax=Acacia crassicarpa TaxID=499986 RepID=A0AAE1J6W8_9FABA|nr:hypothetical protein QN277_029000 [Acacia crassicarpa]